MATKRRFLTAVLLAVTWSGEAFAESSFTVKEGLYLWHIWLLNVAYEKQYDWPGFKAKVAEINQLSDDEEAFTKLQSGALIKLPSLPGEETVSSNPAEAERIRNETRREMEAKFAAEKIKLESELKQVRQDVARGGPMSGTALLLMVLAGVAFCITVVLVGSREVRRRDRKVSELQQAVKVLERDSEIQDFFLRRYAISFYLPDDLGKVLGKSSLVYVLKAEERIEGEEAVLVWNSRTRRLVPIKQKNLKRYFAEASNDPAFLDYYGLKSSKVQEEVPLSA